MPVRGLLLVLLLCAHTLGCPRGGATQSSPTAPDAEVKGNATVEAIRMACAKHPCSGKLARLDVYRGADGGLGRVVHHGDITRCSHPPTIYYDGQGAEVLAVPQRPVTQEAERVEFKKKHEAAVSGFVRTETADCEGRVRPAEGK